MPALPWGFLLLNSSSRAQGALRFHGQVQTLPWQTCSGAVSAEPRPQLQRFPLLVTPLPPDVINGAEPRAGATAVAEIRPPN